MRHKINHNNKINVVFVKVILINQGHLNLINNIKIKPKKGHTTVKTLDRSLSTHTTWNSDSQGLFTTVK